MKTLKWQNVTDNTKILDIHEFFSILHLKNKDRNRDSYWIKHWGEQNTAIRSNWRNNLRSGTRFLRAPWRNQMQWLIQERFTISHRNSFHDEVSTCLSGFRKNADLRPALDLSCRSWSWIKKGKTPEALNVLHQLLSKFQFPQEYNPNKTLI